ncbi:MAG: tetratricopeptide repeat protein [Dichotomicrobium sp.]
MKDDRIYNTLKWVAIVLGVSVLSIEVYRHFSSFDPGEIAYVDANSSFNAGSYDKALELYKQSLRENPDYAPAWRGLANTYVQLQQYEEALTAIEQAIATKPDFGGYYAIRGIIHDHEGRYRKAIEDYEKAVSTEPTVTEGMHWLDRLLHNVQEVPPTIADRLGYLKHQMSLPPEERVLRVPELDAQQRPYER